MITEAVGLVSFGVDTEELGDIRGLNEELIQPLLPEVIEFIG